MIRKIKTVEDVKVEIEGYFEVMRWLPDIERPKCKTANLPYVSTPSINDYVVMSPDITPNRISKAWFIDEHWMSPPLIYPNEYSFLKDFLSPLPKKVVAYNHHTSRAEVYRWADRLLNRIFNTVKP